MANCESRDPVGPVLEALLDCTLAALCDSGREPGLASLVPGSDVAWDNCCGDKPGQLYVRLMEMYPTAGAGAFPGRDTRPRCSPNLWGVRVAVGVIRCVHTVDEQGTPPTADEMQGDALNITKDAAAVRDGILCCFVGNTRNLDGWVLEGWQPQGPRGGCAGGEWVLTLGIATCSCPEPAEE